MKLYFSPLACSMASRIAFYEAGASVTYVRVDAKTKRLKDGSDFFAINPMGQVPVLSTDVGMLLTENSAILQYIAEQFPDAKLAPPPGAQRAKLQQWLGFIGTELHKSLFVSLLDPNASAEVKAYSREKAPLRLGLLDKHLKLSEYLLDRFTVADAYLTTVLNWAAYCDIDLARWPAVQDYYQHMIKRPSIAKAMSEEYAMYKEEIAQQKKQ